MTHPFWIPLGYETRNGSFPSYNDNRHLTTIGPTRSGKGATIIVPVSLRVPHSMFIVDPKGQIAAITGRRRYELGQHVLFLNPFGLHSGPPWRLPRHRFNPLAALDPEHPNFVANVGALAQALIITQGREPYFDDTARNLIVIILVYLIVTFGKSATLGMMRAIILAIAARSKEGMAYIATMQECPLSIVSQGIGRFADIGERNDLASAVSTAVTQTSFLDDPAFTHPETGCLSGSDFDMLQLKEWPTTVYVILPGNYMETYSRFLRLLITSAIESLTASPGGHPVLMMLDEAARLERLPALTSAFGYSAGFGLQLWPFWQDLAQLEHIYQHEWESLLGNCGVTQFFTPADMKTADYISRRGGMTTSSSRSRSYGGLWRKFQSESQSESRVPLLPPEYTFNLAPDKSVIFYAGTHSPFITGRAPYWTIPQLAGTFDPDPFHME
ncbi:MAG: hypothetical protein A4S14_14680 [Proteobacteria bacterium SG_bin9]|nr:MAG: hypothetical protein A4S14_14680 [Proteobacteria bacterium SG_bin9]